MRRLQGQVDAGQGGVVGIDQAGRRDADEDDAGDQGDAQNDPPNRLAHISALMHSTGDESVNESPECSRSGAGLNESER